LRIYFKIFLPMSKAPLVVLGMGVFMGYWNSFLWPSLTVNDPGKMQIMQLIRSLSSVYATEYGAIMAATTIAIIPPLALFLFFKKYIVQGVVLSGIK
jgi:multiple sugar transport system permease protein